MLVKIYLEGSLYEILAVSALHVIIAVLVPDYSVGQPRIGELDLGYRLPWSVACM